VDTDLSLTRRTFVQAAAIATAAKASSPLLGAAAKPSLPSARIMETDVLVCGGGCAGSAAALAAARAGAKTLLVEKAPFAGGIITSVGLPYFDGIAHITTKRVVVRGIALAKPRQRSGQ
jgi:NADPH-dependent 2,4-dienoyl-CoA reductase/sulfur reductase-like enzyme